MKKHICEANSKDYSMSFKLQIVQEIEEDNLQLRNPQRLIIQNRTTVVKWLRKFGNFDWENQTPFTMSKSPEQKIMDLKPSKTRNRSLFWNDRPLLQKKSNHFDMMIDIAEEEYKIDIRKNSPPNNRPF
jgi:hypothetical protein